MIIKLLRLKLQDFTLPIFDHSYQASMNVKNIFFLSKDMTKKIIKIATFDANYSVTALIMLYQTPKSSNWVKHIHIF